MDRENEKNLTVKEWCEKNNNYNLINNWDWSKNGEKTPDNMPKLSHESVFLKCKICGRESHQLLYRYSCKIGCNHCRGNKYIDLGGNGDYTVYCHKTPDGKRYIGMTKSRISKRFSGGHNYHTTVFRNAIEKYGWKNIDHIVLESGLTKEEASEKEKYYIDYYNTLDERYGYNISNGGIHGYHPIKHSKKSIEKISIANKGKNRSVAREVCKLDKDGNVIETYSSIAEAAMKNNRCFESIARCARGKGKTCCGYTWKYKSDMEANYG